MKDDFLDRMFDTHKKLVWENEQYSYYVDDDTKRCTAKARAMDIHGMELRGWTVLMVVTKTEEPEKFFVIFDENGEPYHDTTSIYDMYDWIDIKKIAMRENYDIVTMAERLKEEEE